MRIAWTPEAWEDYVYLQETDIRKCRKINKLIRDIRRDPYSGEGKPELLSYELSGKLSRRIDHEHRLVYEYDEVKDEVTISQCRFHYKK